MPADPGATELSDAALVAAFETCTLPPAAFGHRAHLRVAWIYLREGGVAHAVLRFREHLRRFAAAHGAHDRYHETMTWGWILLVHDRMQRLGGHHSFEELLGASPDLLDAAALRRYYHDATLASPLARRVFLLPDRLADA